MAHIVLQIKSQKLAALFEKHMGEVEECFDCEAPVEIHGIVTLLQRDFAWAYDFPKSLNDIISNISGILTNSDILCKDDMDEEEYDEGLEPLLSEIFYNSDALEASFEKVFFGDFDDSEFDEDSMTMPLTKSFYYDKESGETYYESGEKGSEYLYSLIN